MEKIERGYSLNEHVEGQSRHLDASELSLDLTQELLEMRQGGSLQTNAHTAKTLVKYPDLRVVLMAFKAGASLGRHSTVGQLSIQTLEGRVRLRLEGDEIDLPKGGLFALGSGVPHDIEAFEESAVLLTIAWPNAGEA